MISPATESSRGHVLHNGSWSKDTTEDSLSRERRKKKVMEITGRSSASTRDRKFEVQVNRKPMNWNWLRDVKMKTRREYASLKHAQRYNGVYLFLRRSWNPTLQRGPLTDLSPLTLCATICFVAVRLPFRRNIPSTLDEWRINREIRKRETRRTIFIMHARRRKRVDNSEASDCCA